MDLANLAQRWLACFETKNADALVALYAENARHTSPKLRMLRPETGGSLVGRAALREWWADSFKRLPGLRYVKRSFTAGENRVIIEYLRYSQGDPDLPVAEVLDIGADGLIQASRVYHG